MTDQKKDVEYYLDSGIEKGRKGMYKEALADLEEAVTLDPKNANAYYNRALAKNYLGRNDEAINDYDEAIRLYSKYTNAYYNRGKTKDDLGRKKEALTDYDETIKLDPKYTNAYNNRGNVKSDLGLHEEAINDYDETIRLDPKLAEAYYNRGLIKRQLGQNKQAVNDFRIFTGLADESMDEFKKRALSFIKEIEDAKKKKKKAKKKKAKKKKKKKTELKEKPEPVTPEPIPAPSDKPYKDIHSAAVMFIDMCESTRKMYLYKELNYLEVYNNFEKIFLDNTEDKGLIYKKGLGDGFMAVFRNEANAFGAEVNALEAAVGILDALAKHNVACGENERPRIDVRIGIEFGLVFETDDDVFGIPVNTAARIEGIKEKDFKDQEINLLEKNRIIIPHVVYVSIKDKYQCSEIGLVDMKGFEGAKLLLYNVDWENPKN